MRGKKQARGGNRSMLAFMAILILLVLGISVYRAMQDKLPVPVHVAAEQQPDATTAPDEQAALPADEVFEADEPATSPPDAQQPEAASSEPDAQQPEAASPEPEAAQPNDASQSETKRSLFGISMQDMLAMEIPAVKAVDPSEYPDDPYWAMEDENTDADSEQAASILENQPEEEAPIPFTLPEVHGDGPRVLVYCTHSNEAFKQVESAPYVESTQWRTMDPNNSILRVAGNFAQVLNDQYGIPVLFDSTDHEQGKFYTVSYERSLESVRRNQQENAGLQIFLDIHRDATSAEAGKNDVVMVDGKPCAKIMIVVGTGEGKTGQGFAERPNWQENKKFADAITAELNKIAPGLARDVRVKTGRYNQHVSDHSLAIEVGHNMNTLEESLNSTPYLALAIANVVNAEQ